jgi:hypothetical protein
MEAVGVDYDGSIKPAYYLKYGDTVVPVQTVEFGGVIEEEKFVGPFPVRRRSVEITVSPKPPTCNPADVKPDHIVWE